MTNRMGNSVAAILLGALASVTLVVAVNGVARATEACLSGPKGAAPKGSHWYYRIDHATKRNCWYVRAEGEPAAVLADPHVKRAYLGEEDEVLVDPDDAPQPAESAA